MSHLRNLGFVVLVAAQVACGSSSKGGPAAGAPPGGTGGIGPSGPPPTTTPSIPVPAGGMPAPAATTDLAVSTAPDLGTVNYVANRSSVRLYLPGVMGARDYRVFAVENGVTVSVDSTSREHVDGATIHCSGLRQRNQCDDGEVLPVKYNTEELDLPVCEQYVIDRRPNVPTALMQTLDVDGIGPNTTLVVEAIDRQCPFPGLFGSKHIDVKINDNAARDAGGDPVVANVNGQSYSLKLWTPLFPVRTEDEIRAQYGSMILNGQGPNMPTLDPSSPNFPESPYIRVGQPADPDDPVVLARSVVSVSPTGTAMLPDGFTDQDIFDDFEDDSDQPAFVRNTDPTATLVGVPVNVYQNSKWTFYDVGNEFSDFFVNRGQLNMVFGDPSQDSMSVQAMYPNRPVQLPSQPDAYLHVSYEVQRDETPRRYENLVLCGSDQAGQTYNGTTPIEAPLPRPGFMNEDDTARTSGLGWNCLLLIPRGTGYGVIPGGDITSHSDSSLKITVVKTNPPPPDFNTYNTVKITPYATAYGPTQESAYPRRWLRQQDAAGTPDGVWLDDQLNIWQRTRFDVFIRRDRVVMYVEGQQRICQNITKTPLTMAEGALGFWHILYHTSAEFTEIRRGLQTDNPQTGQHHVMHNTPFADQRSWDNVGIRENVTLPSNFDETLCYQGDGT